VGLLTVLAFVAMGIDKALAASRSSRVSERSLWSLALLGGFLGTVAGGFVFHHKTSKASFWGPVIVSAVIWAALFVMVYQVRY